MAKKTRVAALVQAIETASTEFKTAMKTRIQALPHSRFVIWKHGFSADAIKPFTSAVPQPIKTAQAQNKKNAPMKRIDPMMARGSVRCGSWLSSASGATASNPVNAKIEKTTPRNSPLRLGALAGLYEA